MPVNTNKTQGTAVEITQLVHQAAQWFASPQGQQVLTETVRKSVETTEKLRDAQRVDPKSLHEPITL
jgi:hypothetical protein